MTQDSFSLVQALPEYQQFRKAFAERKLPLAIVCGSGLSAPAGIPMWEKLRKDLELQASNKVTSLNKMGQQYFDGKLKSAKKEKDNWVAFALLREILGGPTFNNCITDLLSPARDAKLPQGYVELMRLQAKCVVTLNLDKFPGEAMAHANPGKVVTPLYGKELAEKWPTVAMAPQYLVYLHGELSDPSNWILTINDLQLILSSKAHEQFIYNLYLQHLVLFVGVGLQDVALSARLLEMRNASIVPPALYWLTTKLDESTIGWAREHNVSLINYVATSAKDHVELLHKFADDLCSYLPSDDERISPQPKSSRFGAINGPTDPKLLAQMEPEQVRRVITNRLQSLLSNTAEDDLYSRFQEFCKGHRFPLNRAFFKDDAEGFREWFGYQLHFPSLGRGNFGEVFQASGPDGHLVAIKILHESILNDNNMLGGFRRGIRSMRYLAEGNVVGIVPLRESFELPPTIVMAYVEGVTLQQAVEARPNLPWTIRLSIIKKVAEIVQASHSLSRTVMHRDLKPSNIMIRNFDFCEWFDPDIVVLDFDMSWHKGSSEKDVVFESRDDFGYLAPEQTARVRGVSAVSTRVDSYGLGMTTYYLFGGEHPRPNEGLSADWLEVAFRAAKRNYEESWRSAPKRLARLIKECTRIQQMDRQDFSLATKELQNLHNAVLDPGKVDNPELWAEEMLSYIAAGRDYEWDMNRGRGVIKLASGIEVSGWPDYRGGAVIIQFDFGARGQEHYQRLSQGLEQLPSKFRKALQKNGWKYETDKGVQQIRIVARINVAKAQENSVDAMKAIGEAFRHFEGIGYV
jgi:serine/threonine protein kinase